MRRIFMAAVLVACIWAAASFAVEANSGGRIHYNNFAASGDTKLEFVYLTGEALPSGFTLYSNDATAFWIQRRFAEGLRDTIPLAIPAGRSMLIPSPGANVSGDSTYITIFLGGHTDTVYALPWFR